MGFKEVEPKATTLLPVGGLIRVGDLVDGESAIFGDKDIRLAATKDYRPLVPDEGERVHGRWVAEHTSNGMFEILGSWLSNSDLQQGTLATGALANWADKDRHMALWLTTLKPWLAPFACLPRCF